MNDRRYAPRNFALVTSGPSGAGKTSILKEVMTQDPRLRFSVSATTRKRRSSEIDGKDYYFLTDEAFQKHVDDGSFLEWAQVYGHRYGTLHKSVNEIFAQGKDPVLDIDIQGARSVGKSDINTVFVFVTTRDLVTLGRRLTGRGTEMEHSLGVRLSAASQELEATSMFDYMIVNDELDRAVDDLRAILKAERLRVARCLDGLLQ